jgi:RNA recognition motif-containing protein
MDPAVQPNATLYINNLNDKINKEELRTQLYALFATHGKVIDVVATKSPKMRGQAFLVFADLAGATAAMRACAGMTFYDKPLVRNASQSVLYFRLIQPGSRSLFPHTLQTSIGRLLGSVGFDLTWVIGIWMVADIIR